MYKNTMSHLMGFDFYCFLVQAKATIEECKYAANLEQVRLFHWGPLVLRSQGWQDSALLLQVLLVVPFQGQLREENNVTIQLFRLHLFRKNNQYHR